MDGIRAAILCLLVLGSSVSSLRLTGPSVHTARLGSDTLVPCLVTVDNPPVDPEHITIFWLHQDKEILSYDKSVRTTSPRYSLSTEALGAGTGDLTITNIQIPDGGMYKCSVTYRSQTKEKEIRLDVGAPPQVMVTGNTVVMNKESVLRCSITGFYPVDIDIRWFRGTELQRDASEEKTWTNPDRTYNVTSSLTLTPSKEDIERNFSCRVQHEFLQEPLQKTFHLYVSPEYEEGTSAGIIAACIIVPMGILLIAGALWWTRKLRLKAPALFIVRDIEGPPKLIDGEETTLYCTVDNYPENLCVTWLIRRAGQEEEIQTSQMRGHSEEEKESLLDTSYVIRSQREGCQYLTSLSFIPHIQRYRDVTFICRGVSKEQQEEKTFYRETVYAPGPFIVRDIKGPPKLIDGEETTLYCTVDDSPENLCVTWLIRRAGQEEEEIQTSQMRGHSEEVKESLLDTSYVIRSQPEGRQYSSSLSFIPHIQRHRDVTFICRGVSKEQQEEKRFHYETVYAEPHMLEPIQITMAASSHVQFSLTLQKFYPKGIRISWHLENTSGNLPLSAVERWSTQDDDPKYNVTSVVSILLHTVNDRQLKIVVEWKHESMETRETRSITMRDLPWRPHVGSINIPNLEDETKAALTCDISGYFPDLLSITWFTKKVGDLTPVLIQTSGTERTYKMSHNEKQENDNTYCYEASLTFTPIISLDEGSEIICRVDHPSLERPIERSTAPLHIGVKKTVGKNVKQWFKGMVIPVTKTGVIKKTEESENTGKNKTMEKTNNNGEIEEAVIAEEREAEGTEV
ncbi:uncharacterized protein [Dendropsophus ebraccatus]|uniref:uncharacterized protein n=1 Tax=Dendropsophus ebraccatus TaxID=150705 RepID=UPI0038319A5E